MRHAELLLNGFYIGGPCDTSVAKQVVRSPWTGQVVGTAAEGGPAELVTAAESAHDSFQSWSRLAPEMRAMILDNASRAITARRDEFAELLMLEIGKPIAQAEAEVQRAAITFALAAAEARRIEKTTVDIRQDPRSVDFIAGYNRVPRGVVLAITPYNWPVNLAAHKIAPALAAGCAVVLKGSERAPLSTLTLARCVNEAGLPHGVINAWNGTLRDFKLGLDRVDFDVLSFTGSAKVGWDLKRQFWDKQATLELGGNCSVVISKDADIDAAIPRIVAGAFAYAGQICISVQHVWAHDTIYDRVRHRLIEAVNAVRSGDPSDRSVLCGPMIDASEAARVREWIVEAESLGASVIATGRVEDHPNLIAPTLLENVEPPAKLATEEAFGPVLTLGSFHNENALVDQLNEGRYGVQAGLFTEDATCVQYWFEHLEVGGLVVNDVPTIRFDAAPYGGTKNSGVGREGVRFAMDEFTQTRSLVQRIRRT
jgi:acyl-CoA reductase-like NAD-dependent aldehyde dehydrogenase